MSLILIAAETTVSRSTERELGSGRMATLNLVLTASW